MNKYDGEAIDFFMQIFSKSWRNHFNPRKNVLLTMDTKNCNNNDRKTSWFKEAAERKCYKMGNRGKFIFDTFAFFLNKQTFDF
jgi:hypothetical protein